MARARRIGAGVGLVLLAAWAMLACPAPRAAAAERGTLDYRGDVVPERQVARLAERALSAPGDSTATARFLDALAAHLQDLGYLDAGIEARWDSTPPRLVVVATEGPLYRLGRVSIEVGSTDDSARVAAALSLVAGETASPRAIGQAIESALGRLVDGGHPYAVLGASRWTTRDGRVDLAVSGALGPEVTVSDVRIEGLEVTRAEVVERAMGRLAGEPFSRRAAENARQRMVQLGLFRSVVYDGLEGEADWGRGRLVYRVEERKYNHFEGAIGVQGEAGTVGLADLAMDNLLGTARGFSLRWEGRGHDRSEFGARYREPLFLGAPLGLEVAIRHLVQDTLYVQTRWGLHATYALSAQERLEAGFEQERVVQDQLEVRQADLQNTLFALERDGRDDPVAPRYGTFARLGASQTFKSEKLRPAGKRTVRASAVSLAGEWHTPVGARSGLTWELQSAGRFSSERVLPLFERYPLGGASSLRGFDEEAFRVDRYVLSRLELRWFLGTRGERVFVFWDHAWSGTRLPLSGGGDRFEMLHLDGIGFGARLQAAGGLVGIDYGLEPGKAPLEGKIHLRLVSTF